MVDSLALDAMYAHRLIGPLSRSFKDLYQDGEGGESGKHLIYNPKDYDCVKSE